METMETTTKRADQVCVADMIVTRHGGNFGTVAVEKIERGGVGRMIETVTITGYEQIHAGVCGPWVATFRTDDDVEVRR